MKSSIKFKTTTPLFLIPFLLADAHRGNGKRFVVRADEKLRAFVELDSVIRPGRTPQRIAEGVK